MVTVRFSNGLEISPGQLDEVQYALKASGVLPAWFRVAWNTQEQINRLTDEQPTLLDRARANALLVASQQLAAWDADPQQQAENPPEIIVYNAAYNGAEAILQHAVQEPTLGELCNRLAQATRPTGLDALHGADTYFEGRVVALFEQVLAEKGHL